MPCRIARSALALALCLATAALGAGAEELRLQTLAPPLKGLRLQALAPVAGEAVFRFPDGRVEAVAEGQELAGTGVTLAEVLPDRTVLHLEVEGRRLIAWMYPATRPGKPSRIKLVRFDPPDAPPAPRPVSIDLSESPPHR